MALNEFLFFKKLSISLPHETKTRNFLELYKKIQEEEVYLEDAIEMKVFSPRRMLRKKTKRRLDKIWAEGDRLFFSYEQKENYIHWRTFRGDSEPVPHTRTVQKVEEVEVPPKLLKKLKKETRRRRIKRAYKSKFGSPVSKEKRENFLKALDEEIEKLLAHGVFPSCPRLSALDSAVWTSKMVLRELGLSLMEATVKVRPLQELLDKLEADIKAHKEGKEKPQRWEDDNPIANNPFASLLKK